MAAHPAPSSQGIPIALAPQSCTPVQDVDVGDPDTALERLLHGSGHTLRRLALGNQLCLAQQDIARATLNEDEEAWLDAMRRERESLAAACAEGLL